MAIFAGILSGVILLSLVGISGTLVRVSIARAQADQNWVEAQKQTEIAQQQTRSAEQQRALAEQQSARAEEQRKLADEQRAFAEQRRSRENNLKMRILSSFQQGSESMRTVKKAELLKI